MPRRHGSPAHDLVDADREPSDETSWGVEPRSYPAPRAAWADPRRQELIHKVQAALQDAADASDRARAAFAEVKSAHAAGTSAAAARQRLRENADKIRAARARIGLLARELHALHEQQSSLPAAEGASEDRPSGGVDASVTLAGAMATVQRALAAAASQSPAPSVPEPTAIVTLMADAARQLLLVAEAELSATAGSTRARAGSVTRHRHLIIHHRLQAVEHDGRKHVLTRTEWQLFEVLLESRGTVMSRKELAALAWGSSCVNRSQEVEVYVSRLRRKLEIDSRKPILIKTVRGQGYVLSGQQPPRP